MFELNKFNKVFIDRYGGATESICRVVVQRSVRAILIAEGDTLRCFLKRIGGGEVAWI